MTDNEKRAAFAAQILPDEESDEVLDAMLANAAALVLNKMFPFGYPDGTTVPSRYEYLQIQLAVELYSKRGAEGQTGHNENGISRSWPEKSRLLAQIMPQCGSVISNA
jgi:hypothetical protein